MVVFNEISKPELRKLISELSSKKGRHTELISIYVPDGYNINEITNLVTQEQGTATNIKSKATRKNVLGALEKVAHVLKKHKTTPPNGLVILAGNVSEKEGSDDFKIWELIPPEPIKIRTYRCDQSFVLEPLKHIIREKEIYGLITIDTQNAAIALLKGKHVDVLKTMDSMVPGKTRAGGQCLAEDSLVQLSDGSIAKIENVHNPLKVKSLDLGSHSFLNSDITDKWNAKKNKVYKIVTKNPCLEIESSKDHVFFVIADGMVVEKSAEELKKGDCLIMPEKIEVKGKRQKLHPLKYYNSFAITAKGRKILKEKREKRMLFQRDLAKKTGVTQTAISVIELGKRSVKTALLKKLCNSLDLNFEQFLSKCCQPYKYRNIKLPDEIDEDFAQFLGYYIGDGSIEKDRITFFEQRKSLALAYKNKFEQYFNIEIRHRFRETKNYHQLRITRRPLVRLIKNEFPEIKKSLDSEIPDKILKSGNIVVAAFLRGLFDAEGYVSKGQKLGISANNKVLIKQLQLALLRFGIISSYLVYNNKENPYSKNYRFTLEISEKKSLELFKNNIGFTSPEKSIKLEAVIENKSNTSYVRQIIVPGSMIRKIIEKKGYNLGLFPKVSCFFRNKRMMSKEIFKNSILKNVNDKILYKELKAICDMPILPARISKINVADKSMNMVDISVKNENFIANGVMVHNSAARFGRVRDGLILTFKKQVGEVATKLFEVEKDLKGIIIGGPGGIKEDFAEGEFLSEAMKKKIIGIKDLSYSSEEGLKELVDRSEDLLEQAAIMKEKTLLNRFFAELKKDSGLAAYGYLETKKALEMGAVEILIISEDIDLKNFIIRCKSCDFETEKVIKEQNLPSHCPKCSFELEIAEQQLMKLLEKKAKEMDTELEQVSSETPEGAQFLQLGGIGGILRFRIE